MKKYLILIISVFSLFSCKKPKEEPVLELISYRWALKDKYFNNQYKNWKAKDVAFVKCELYTQIYKNGDCIVSKSKGKYQNELFANFKIDKVVINSVLNIYSSIKKDTTMTLKDETFRNIYDGPIIRVIGKGDDNLKHTIKFDNSNLSNPDLRELFSYIEIKSRNINSTEILIQAKEKRIREIYEQEINSISIPTIKPDTIFSNNKK